jgi:LemA protein
MPGGHLESQKILERLYPAVDEPREGLLSRLLRRMRRRVLLSIYRLAKRVRRRVWHLLLFGVLITGWAVAHLYYYNMLVRLEVNVQEGWAQVEAQWLRRYHIQQNVTRLVLEYARHEHKMMFGVTGMRTGKPAPSGASKPGPAAPPITGSLDQMGAKELNKLFPRIQVTAEQYPALRASENFQQFSKALIDVEEQITKQLMTYNQRVNAFSTVTQQFPGNIFARVCRFKPYRFYVPERGDIKYKPVEYRHDS